MMPHCASGLACLGLQQQRATVERHHLITLFAGLYCTPRHDDPGSSPSSSSTTPPTPRIEVRPSPGRGLGLFTLERIPAFTLIVKDDALLSIADGEDLPQLWDKYCALPPDMKAIFDDLAFSSDIAAVEPTMVSKLERRGYASSQAHAMARVSSRWQANAFKTGQPVSTSPGSPTWAYALFPNVARINHSCTPNACAHYRPPGAQVVYAVRDIEPDEEIEIAYFDPTMQDDDRQARAAAWGFKCSCPACIEEGEVGRESDYGLDRFCVLSALSVPPNFSIQAAIDVARFFDHPWLAIALPKLYLALFDVLSRQHGEKSKLRDALQQALEWQEKITGPDSPASRERRKALQEFDNRA